MELNPESKEAVRKYMASIVLLPIGVMSAIGFALGWFINEGARGAAYAEAYSQAQNTITQLATEAATSSEKAKQALSDTNELRTAAEKSASYIKTQADTAHSIIKQLNEKTNVDAKDVAEALKPVFEKEFKTLVSSSISSKSVKLVDCKTINGPVGIETAKNSMNAYMDRLSFTCPGGTVMKSIKFNRQPSSGPNMVITSTCCSLVVE